MIPPGGCGWEHFIEDIYSWQVMSHYIILTAILLDLLIGDPIWLYHPVRFFGYLTRKHERWIRVKFDNLKAGGVVLNLLIVLPTYFITLLIVKLLDSYSAGLSFVFSCVVIYFCLAINSLTAEGWIIRNFLIKKDLSSARNRLSTIVSRDVSREDGRGIIRGTIETLTENLSDGIIAPLFFAMIGGAPLALAYKAINTLDSMVGYKNEKYINLGWFSARLDDLVNLIPARLTGLLLVLTSIITFKHPLKAIQAWWRDAQKGPSPNGGIPIVTFAGAMDITLGGECYDKEGRVINIPEVGGLRKELKTSDIVWANLFIYLSTALMVVGYLLVIGFLL